MRLTMQGVVPVHLQEAAKTHRSEVWGKAISIESGEYVFVHAPSGTGKSTFIHVLYGLRNDYTGSVQWDNTEIATYNAQSLASLRASKLSIIFQDLRLFPMLTTLENIEIKRQLNNTVNADQAVKWLERLGMGNKLQAEAATLSYGEQQRVAIVRALVQPFCWLLMDEPFSHLDNANRSLATELISEVLKERNAGMILADLDSNNHFRYTQKLMM
ncbi:MAG: ATP-binding cassette domain-containing protein [Taibaiella sp.]|nr:ATP-binding cassette domain-containing protein [Taibaiella sp.]